MSRLIDADALKDKAREIIPNYHASVVMNLFDLIDNLADNMPTIEALQGRKAGKWTPVSEGLPDDLEEVNVTWVNHDPEPYYNFVKDKSFTATAVYYKEEWYWYSSTCADFLAEYGRNPYEEIDDGIEIIAWMPLPEPLRGEENE